MFALPISCGALSRAAGSDEAWTAAVENLFRNAEQLANAITSFEDGRLEEAAPGRQYSFYFLFHGIVQHSLYHAGQIAILKKALS